MTSVDDIALAIEAGADAVGVILAESPRRVPLERLEELALAVPPFVTKVGVVVRPGDAEIARLRALDFTLQFSGDESLEFCERASGDRPYLKAFHLLRRGAYKPDDFAALGDHKRALWMFDTSIDGKAGGTGVTFAWGAVEPIAKLRPIVIAGGLTPENVGECIRAARPFGVDVRSGIETGGKKDPQKMRAFVRAVQDADAPA
jgi:phosphoribosylanthranilate isomerase